MYRKNRKVEVSPEIPTEKKSKDPDATSESAPKQLLSYTCMALSSSLVIFALVSLILALLAIIDWLQLIDNLSLIKTIVTLCKYVPQVSF